MLLLRALAPYPLWGDGLGGCVSGERRAGGLQATVEQDVPRRNPGLRLEAPRAAADGGRQAGRTIR